MIEIKREIDVREFECPFCGNIQSELISDSLIDEEIGEAIGYGLDGWECNECDAENEIGLEDFGEDYKVFRQFTDRDDFDGLLDFCKENDFDDFMLTNLVKLYNQQRKFTKTLDILAVVLIVDRNNPDTESIMRNAAIGIRNGREIK